MPTGYALLDHPNPHANPSGDEGFRFHGYRRSREDKRVIGVHTAENAPSVDSAEAIAGYLASTSRTVSYHSVFDSTGEVRLLPSDSVAFGIGNFNSPTIHHSAATRTIYWGKDPSWDDNTIAAMARAANRDCAEHGITVQRISAGAARNGASGFVAHSDMDPGRRSDPGAKFPWAKYLAAVKATSPPEPRVLELGMRGGDVLEWQNDLRRWNDKALPTYGPDGDFGDETYRWTQTFQRTVGIAVDGKVGRDTRRAMAVALAPPPPPDAPHKALAVLTPPETAGLVDKRAAAAIYSAYVIYRARPSEDLRVDDLIVVGGPALRTVTHPQRYRRIHELVGATGDETWAKTFQWVADHPARARSGDVVP